MSINENDVFVCDFCGEDVGKFNQKTGNHPQCEELAILRAREQSLLTALRMAQELNNHGGWGQGTPFDVSVSELLQAP